MTEMENKARIVSATVARGKESSDMLEVER